MLEGVYNTVEEEGGGSIVVEGVASGGSSDRLVWGVVGNIGVWGEVVAYIVVVGDKKAGALAEALVSEGQGFFEPDSFQQGMHLDIQDLLKDCHQGVELQLKHLVVVGKLVMVGGAA